jgi:ubiquitin-conjugating enzyme E2 variant
MPIVQPINRSKYLPFEILAFFLTISCLGYLVYRWFQLGFGPWWQILGAWLVGVLLADLVSGFIHWLMDTWGTPETPVFGELFIRDFRIHHQDEKEMTRHGFFETNGNNAMVLLLVLVPAVLWSPTRPEWIAFIISFASAILFTNQIHKWSHEDKPSRFVTWLQSTHVILPPDVHAMHHIYPHTTYYNITTGWLNLIIELIRIYPAMERAISTVTGWKPRP